MEELIKYFEALEARIATQEERIAALEEAQQTNEAVIASLEADVEDLKSRPAAEPIEVPAPEPVKEPTQVVEPTPVVEEPASPKAALYGKPVDDIRLAISLGDRFLYQRELFNQNAELMQCTLNELNALGSFDEAMDYINARFQWDPESNTYQQFIVTLHRRFG